MKIIKTAIKDIIIITLDIYNDERGFFVEKFNKDKFAQLNLPTNFVQDNHSRSKPKVLRGLHYQTNPAQGKLVNCISGKIQDIIVDIRKDSPTYKKYISIELSEDDNKLIWIPAGFAHGFCVLGNKAADVIYKTDNLYNPDGEKGIIWNDPDLNIKWQIENPIISKKDLMLTRLKDINYE